MHGEKPVIEDDPVEAAITEFARSAKRAIDELLPAMQEKYGRAAASEAHADTLSWLEELTGEPLADDADGE